MRGGGQSRGDSQQGAPALLQGEPIPGGEAVPRVPDQNAPGTYRVKAGLRIRIRSNPENFHRIRIRVLSVFWQCEVV